MAFAGACVVCAVLLRATHSSVARGDELLMVPFPSKTLKSPTLRRFFLAAHFLCILSMRPLGALLRLPSALLHRQPTHEPPFFPPSVYPCVQPSNP